MSNHNERSDAMDTITTAPEIVVECHRYTEPTDGWVFTVLTKDETGSEEPFASDEVVTAAINSSWEEYAQHMWRRQVEGWGETPWAERWRAENLQGFRQAPWEEMPERFRQYVLSSILPCGWGDDEDFCKAMTTIHIKGEWPTA